MNIDDLVAQARASSRRVAKHETGTNTVLVAVFRGPTGWRHDFYVNGKKIGYHAAQKILEKE